MDSGDEDSLFLLDEEVPAADSVAEDYKSRPIDRSFSERNKRRTEWRSHERGRTDNHRDSMYGKSCPAAPIVGSLPAPSHFADDIPDLTLPPNSHQEISHMLSRSQDSFDGDDLELDGGDDEDVHERANERGTQQKAARFLHFEQKRVRRKTRNVFSAMPSSCPAQMHSNFMGGRSFDPRSTKGSTTLRAVDNITTNSTSSSRNLPPRAPTRQHSRQTRQNSHHHRHEDGEGGLQVAAHTDVDHGEQQQGSDGPDPGILSTSQTALSILQNHAQFQKQKQHQPAESDTR